MANISIYEKIEEKGRLDANEINRLGKEKAQALEDSIIESAKQEINKFIYDATIKSDDKLKTKTTQLEQQFKQRSLSRKKELIDKVFDLALKKLNTLDDASYISLITKLILNENIKGDETLKVSTSDHAKFVRLLSSGKMVNDAYVLDKLNTLLGAKYQLKLAKSTVDIDGGFIIIGENYDIDVSYKTLLESIKETYESQIAKMLFEDGE
jgi:V/A-type H+-transporting ATPase subunit E